MARCRVVRSLANFLAKRSSRFLLTIVPVLVTSCAQTSIRPLARTTEQDLPPPPRILVYNFAVSGAEVTEYPGIMRQQPSKRDASERQRVLAVNVSETLAAHLAHGLSHLGLVVKRVERGAPAGANDVIVDGRFVAINEGNPLRRWAIGFGSGASKLDTRVQLFRGNRQPLLEFATRADSGRAPGAVATLPAGVVARDGARVALTAGTTVHTGLNGSSLDMSRLAASSADQAVRYLSEFFAKRGWISADQVKKARFDY
jgi:hypothetical protein